MSALWTRASRSAPRGVRCDGCGRISSDPDGYYTDASGQGGTISSRGRECSHDFCDQCEDACPKCAVGGARADQAARILELEAALGDVLRLQAEYNKAFLERQGQVDAEADAFTAALTEAERVLRGEEPADGPR